MTPASAPTEALRRFVKIAVRRGNYPASLGRLLYTAVSRVVASMRNPAATVADVEPWLDGRGASPAAFASKFEISAATHATYVSRTRKVLADYFRCGGDVASWPVPPRARPASQGSPAQTVLRDPSAPRPNAIELPLSEGRSAQLTFPVDLSQAEARAIAAQLDGVKAVFLARAALENPG